MATKPESKIDAAAEKAYAEAAAKKVDTAAAGVAAAAPVPPVVAEKAAPVAAPEKVLTRKVAAQKPAPRKAAAKKTSAKKTPAKKTPAKKAAKIATPKAGAPKRPVAAAKATELKDTIMTKAKTTAADFTVQVKEGLATAQERAKAAYDKSTVLAAEMGEFSKGNLEAVVESGKILASGVQTLAKTQFEDAKAAVEVLTADVKEMTTVKSPTDFVQLQGKIASRNFDAAVAQLSKTTEAWVKLANDSFAPISSRAAVAMEKVRKAA